MFNLSQLLPKAPPTPPLPFDGNPSRHSKNPTIDKEKTSSFRIDDILIKTKPTSSTATASEATELARAQGHPANNPLFAQLSSMYNCFSPMVPNKGLPTQQPPLTPDIISMLYGRYLRGLGPFMNADITTYANKNFLILRATT